MTTVDTAIRVKDLNSKIGSWISKLGFVHVEGQITQINARPGTKTAFVTLRDPDASASISVTCSPDLLSSSLTDGARVVVFGKPSFWQGRGSLSMRASEIHELGEGELLAKQDLLRKVLHTEGAFEPGRKRPIPFAPGVIGLITGRASAAERDVCSIVEARWPAAKIKVRNTPVQGASTVPKVIEAILELDRDPDVEVIVIARGGGSVEDLLPFSEEKLLRTAIACKTPIVSAIGHEPDHPILDDVADVRAATPTDAAKRIVPDIRAEIDWVETHRRVIRRIPGMAIERARDDLAVRQAATIHIVRTLVTNERDQLSRAQAHNTRQVRALPARHRVEVHTLADRLESYITQASNTQRLQLQVLQNGLADLGPQSALNRGYAVVRNESGQIVRTREDITDQITITTNVGSFRVRVQR